MDFEYHYTPAQEAFRKEVAAWLDANIPAGIKRPRGEEMEAGLYDWAREFTMKLGAKGWLFPTYPKEYGGGGMSAELATVIHEEMEKREAPVATGNTLDLPAIAVWGTEAQKQKFLKGRLTGQLMAFQNFTEPSAGSDLASLKTRAVKDGDEWVITGEKVFVSGSMGKGRPRKPDHLFTPAITDPNAPRHRNLGYFLVPGDAPGVTLQPLALLTGNGQNQVYMDSVRVSAERLIGGETQGWQVSQSTLEIEHGGGGELPGKNKFMGAFLKFVKESGVGKDEHLQQTAVDAFIDSENLRLLATRNHWMYSNRKEMSFHGSQQSLWGKEGNLRIADQVREVAGLRTLLDEKDKGTVVEGDLERQQKGSLMGAHPGGTVEIQKVIIARRIGVSRTKERAAPTPSTAGV